MKRIEFFRVGTGVNSSHNRREDSEEYPHNSSQDVRPWLLPAAPAYSEASAIIVVPFTPGAYILHGITRKLVLHSDQFSWANVG